MPGGSSTDGKGDALRSSPEPREPAGDNEAGVTHPDTTSPQGGVISPLLCNIYLHEVLDKWWAQEALPRLRGRAFMVRYADDFVVVFSDRADADRVHRVLSKRFARFGLTLHPEKTRLIRYRRPRRDGSGPKPGSFDFLGFTHHWARSRRGFWVPKRKTAKGRLRRALRALNQWMRRARHLPVAEQARIIGQKLRGHYAYYGIRGNSAAIGRFYFEARRLWYKWLCRRSQRAAMTWPAFRRLARRHPLPRPGRTATSTGEPVTRGAECVNCASSDLWGAGRGNPPGLPDIPAPQLPRARDGAECPEAHGAPWHGARQVPASRSKPQRMGRQRGDPRQV
ncbi:MAG: hypothetical protein GXP62_14495, partial [Oligoflexia bacterium]|nr:hypothetical protein [Oligoflexia bacterium]